MSTITFPNVATCNNQNSLLKSRHLGSPCPNFVVNFKIGVCTPSYIHLDENNRLEGFTKYSATIKNTKKRKKVYRRGNFKVSTYIFGTFSLAE
ncbi:hypothetical protein B566_EDAN008051, partial [Ephemera danica]